MLPIGTLMVRCTMQTLMNISALASLSQRFRPTATSLAWPTVLRLIGWTPLLTLDFGPCALCLACGLPCALLRRVWCRPAPTLNGPPAYAQRSSKVTKTCTTKQCVHVCFLLYAATHRATSSLWPFILLSLIPLPRVLSWLFLFRCERFATFRELILS